MDDYYMTYFSPRGMQCVYKGISLQCWKENRKTTSQLQRERKPDIICQILLSKSVLCVASGKKMLWISKLLCYKTFLIVRRKAQVIRKKVTEFMFCWKIGKRAKDSSIWKVMDQGQRVGCATTSMQSWF